MIRAPLLNCGRAILIATFMLGLPACSLQPSKSTGSTSQSPSKSTSSTSPPPSKSASAASHPPSKPHPHFAPPPQGRSHWDPQLGVHVLENAPALYYRERTYYHWNNGWSWAVQPTGPWQACPSSAVPPGLNRYYAK